MADPVTLLVGASAVIGAAGSLYTGAASASAANANAKAEEQNATYRAQDRITAIRSAEIAADDKRREHRRQYAALRAAYGSSGLELAGSPLDVLADTSMEMAVDQRRVEYEGQVQGRDLAIGVNASKNSASMYRSQSSSSMTAGYLNAGSSLLSGAGRAYEYQKG